MVRITDSASPVQQPDIGSTHLPGLEVPGPAATRHSELSLPPLVALANGAETRTDIHPSISAFFRDHTTELRRYGTTDQLTEIKRALAGALNLPAGIDPNQILLAHNAEGSALGGAGIAGSISLGGDPPMRVGFKLSYQGEIRIEDHLTARSAIGAEIRRLRDGLQSILPAQMSAESLDALARDHGALSVTQLRRDGLHLYFISTNRREISSDFIAMYATAEAGIPPGPNGELRRMQISRASQDRGGGFAAVGNFNVAGTPPSRIILSFENAIRNPQGTPTWTATHQAGLVPGGTNFTSGVLRPVPMPQAPQ